MHYALLQERLLRLFTIKLPLGIEHDRLVEDRFWPNIPLLYLHLHLVSATFRARTEADVERFPLVIDMDDKLLVVSVGEASC